MTLKSFTHLLSHASFNDNVLRLEIGEDWMQGRTTYGGLSAALCVEAAMRLVPDLPPLRSANIAFVGPAGGATECTARELRRGKSVISVAVDLIGPQGLATHCTLAFGASRESQLSHTWTPRPHLPGPDDCEAFIPDGMGPNFVQQFETRLAKGARPASASKDHDHFIWVRHRDKSADGLVALIALADMPPPAVLPMASEFSPISSITWMFNVLSESPETRDGWWLLESRAEHAAQGYSSQDMLVWNRDFDLVLAGRQSVAIFF